MNNMNKKIEFSATNVKAFSTWLKKFSSIDTALLLEVDEIGSKFMAKTYNEERSVVKSSSIKFEDAGLTIKLNSNPNLKRIKVGIYNISRFMKIMDQFNNEEFTLVINYDEVAGNEVEYAGINIILKNKNLKMIVECTSLNIFKYIPDELFDGTIASLNKVLANFPLTKENIEQINSVSVLDNEHKFMEFKSIPDIFVAGKTFDLLIYETDNKIDGTIKSINIFKEQFESIDLEDYNVKMGEDRIVFAAADLMTTTVISMVEKD